MAGRDSKIELAEDCERCLYPTSIPPKAYLEKPGVNGIGVVHLDPENDRQLIVHSEKRGSERPCAGHKSETQLSVFVRVLHCAGRSSANNHAAGNESKLISIFHRFITTFS
ncbi:hypothetical protein FGSG_12252 [Fusarium graminearum PH-1]|uniref:hypothetical protein n=1 Tax=Gibberella zeae (strain ATCC MYA-4620 / CBS 123657 / FGSC 9075 / NRRL 31084 / PH-1) TaxID=229533 RepID=UPI00021F1D12|nr:hypothetical protein FGSG_12252 [Fusarium graminearum PH-1]ESU08635.1 hypothetical protein FGSG_12252 [Fusarium graminearum PH-1]|eukprot:XP_011321134.1 hypothetical protein FGSG_12252 [Fusarium graminearum PH-1]